MIPTCDGTIANEGDPVEAVYQINYSDIVLKQGTSAGFFMGTRFGVKSIDVVCQKVVLETQAKPVILIEITMDYFQNTFRKSHRL